MSDFLRPQHLTGCDCDLCRMMVRPTTLTAADLSFGQGRCSTTAVPYREVYREVPMADFGRALDPPVYGQGPTERHEVLVLERNELFHIEACVVAEGLTLTQSLREEDADAETQGCQHYLVDQITLTQASWTLLVEWWMLRHPDAAQRLAAKVRPLCKEHHP